MKRKLIEGTVIGVAAALAALILWSTGFLDRWEHATWAWRVQVFAKPGSATDRVKLILLDQASLDWGKKQNGLSWPWPREIYAPIIDFCKRHGARAVIFDVLYSEPSVYGVSDDEALGHAIARSPNFIGALELHSDSIFSTAWPADIANNFFFDITNIREWLSTASSAVTMASATFPIEEVASSAAVIANVMDEPDDDSIFRRASLFRVFEGRVVPSPGFAAFAIGSGYVRKDSEGPPLCSGKIANNNLEICGKNIPVDSEARLLLRFRGQSGTFETFSAAGVIESEILAASGGKETIQNAESLRDAYVFFGFSAPGLLDLRPTPISRIYPGVEIHATMLDNLLSGDFLRDAPTPAVAFSTLFFCLLASLCVVVLAKRVRHSVAAIGVFVPLPAALGFAAYPLGFWWPIVVQEGGVVLALAAAVVLNYATEGRRRALVKKAFQHYLSPDVIERILKDPGQLKLGGERRELTIFFSDLEGFSSFSERLDSEALTSLLNDYLSDMTDIILEEGGTLDKYEGDAIIAFWNAPLSLPDHAERACRAALRCQQKLAERREEFRQRTGAVLRARIGLNTGEVHVGNMGSKKRFDYTVLGDAANLASRLEGANKAFGTYTMVSDATRQKTSGALAARQIGLLRVVGRAEPVRVFELKNNSGQTDTHATEEFERGLAFCFEKKWREALDIFAALPDDPVAKVYSDRCRKLLDNPAKSWDCIWNLASK